MPNATCVLENCNNAGKLRRGLCGKHYQSAKLHGDLGNFHRKLIHPGATLDERLRHHGWTVTDNGCWEWSGFRNGKGYGQLAVGAKGCAPMLTNRAAYTAWVGPIPEDHVILHRCDNPPCINPGHLLLGTSAENSADMAAKRRTLNGENRPQAKLTDMQIEAIRNAYGQGGVSQSALAESHGVSQSAISMIVNRKRRPHLTYAPQFGPTAVLS